MMLLILIFAGIGFFISLYTYKIEQEVKKNPDYKPVCDLSDRISCSKPIKSPYANIFIISNATLGMLFYILIAILAILNANTLLLIASIGGCIMSLIFAYLLYFKIKSLCLLCTLLYIINFIIFTLIFIKIQKG